MGRPSRGLLGGRGLQAQSQRKGKDARRCKGPWGRAGRFQGLGSQSSPSDLLPAAKKVRLLSEEGHSTQCLGESAGLQGPSAEDGRCTAWCEPSAGLGGHSPAWLQGGRLRVHPSTHMQFGPIFLSPLAKTMCSSVEWA